MSKKAAKKQVQALSPEKYIRQKSRNLPIFKCWINKNWEESRLANIVIARQHVGKSLTVCIYLVDLYCLGVKDTYYLFNILESELDEFFRENDRLEFTGISYELAHNIIYSALEFAEEYGFSPHRDFTQTTGFFLEEDTDDIPLIEIECGGKDGKPMYINSGHENPARERQILNQLEKNAGKGNFHYSPNTNEKYEPEDYDDYDEEEEEDENEEYYGDEKYLPLITDMMRLGKEKQRELFFEILNRTIGKDPKTEDLAQLIVLSKILAMEIVGEEDMNEQLDTLKEKWDHPIVTIDEFPEGIFAGVQVEDKDAFIDSFCDALDTILNTKNAKKAATEFRKEAGETPITCYLELLYIQKKSKKEYAKKVEEYYHQYPDYFLFQVEWYSHLLREEKDSIKRSFLCEKIINLLSDTQQPVSDLEANIFLHNFSFAYLTANEKNMMAKIIAMEDYFAPMKDLFTDETLEVVMNSLFTLKLLKLVEVLEEPDSE
jgi:hypothetical protein